jgi:hypothetical protein
MGSDPRKNVEKVLVPYEVYYDEGYIFKRTARFHVVYSNLVTGCLFIEPSGPKYPPFLFSAARGCNVEILVGVSARR